MCLPEKVQCHPHWPAWSGVGDTGLFPGEYPQEGTYYKTDFKVPYLWFLAPRHHENWWHTISGTSFSSPESFIRIHGVEVCKRSFHSFGGLTVPPWLNWCFCLVWKSWVKRAKGWVEVLMSTLDFPANFRGLDVIFLSLRQNSEYIVDFPEFFRIPSLWRDSTFHVFAYK